MSPGVKRGPKAAIHPAPPDVQDWSAPPHFSESARAEFLRCVELLRLRGNLGHVDHRLVTRRVETMEIARVAFEQLQVDGVIVHDENGTPRAHPAVRIHTQATSLLRQLDVTLGLTPPPVRTSTAKPVEAGLKARWEAQLNGA